MSGAELLIICLSAFIAVFILLSVLAAVMRLIIVLFPEKAAKSDWAVVAAVTSVAQATYPDMKVTNVEEIK